MADKFTIDFGIFRYVDLAARWRETTAEEQTRLMKQHESYLETALRMPMYRNLPTGGFKFDWKSFQNHDGLFILLPKRSDDSNQIINNHVKYLTLEQMDTFCAAIFDKATEVLEDLSRVGAEDFWGNVAEDMGIQFSARTAGNAVFWDWAMKLVAARIVCGQGDSHEKNQSLTACDTAGDIEMSDQQNKNMPYREPLSLTAQAVDKFLKSGISRYGKLPKRVKAITRHHNVIIASKPRPDKASNKGAATAKKALKDTRAHKPFLPTSLTPGIEHPIRLRRSGFGSLVGAGQPAWWGSINRPKSPKEISTPQPAPAESQHHAVIGQGSSSQAGTVDDLIVGMHTTAIERAAQAPQVLANLAVRTVNPLKRGRDDTEGAEDSPIGGQPLLKAAKVTEGQDEISS